MRRSAVLGLLLVVVTAGCTTEEPRMPTACADTDTTGYERALRVAPADVRLAGGTRISECLRGVRTGAELESLGAILHDVAERLAVRVREDDDLRAARGLGYLSGAVAAGASASNGISAELARRVEIVGSSLMEVSPQVARALDVGRAAGRAHG